uniref:Uncharacterized protein n=1 Tax=Seriola lalandi dorsalis TaxID=1841481 RepID=A0A3B4XJK1_SERLL
EATNGRGDSGKMEGAKKDKAGSKLSVERVYQKKTQLEHILLRPDTYIGTVEPITQDNKQRDKNMTAIKITIDESNTISIWNNGKG